MSDERFDHDLRSVLLEDAPRDVPDSLRRRVAAIPVTNPAPGGRSRWALPAGMALRAAGAVALVALLAVGFWRLGPAAQPGVGTSPSQAPTAFPTTGPSASVAAGASTTGDACLAADLSGRILSWDGAAGSRIAAIELTSTTASPCLVRGTPGLALVDATGRVLIDSSSAGASGAPHVGPTDPSLELAPGGRLRTEVAVSNYCGAAPTNPIDIALTLPAGGGRLVATPAAGVSSADAVPPCLGSTGSAISMNGWRR